MPKSTEGGANSSSVDHTAAMCNPVPCDSRKPSTKDLVAAIAAVARAASKMIRPKEEAREIVERCEKDGLIHMMCYGVPGERNCYERQGSEFYFL